MDFQREYVLGNSSSLDNLTNSCYLEPTCCYSENDARVCVRIAVLFVLILMMGCAVTGRLIQMYVYRNRNPGQFIVLFLGLFMLIILTVHVIYAVNVQLDFTAIMLVVVQFLVVWLIHLFWASRLLRKEHLFYYVSCPILVLLSFGYIAVYLWALVQVQNGEHDCSRPQWLVFSVCMLILVQLFVITVVVIIKRVDHIRTLRIDRYSQMAQLLFISVVFEFISVFSFVFDMYLFFAAANKDCKDAFSGNENVYLFTQSLNTVVKYLAPQLAFVIIFAPLDHRQFDASESYAKPPTRHGYSVMPSVPNERDPLLCQPINQPELKPSSPEDHCPSLPRSSPYVPTSGFNYYYSNPYKAPDAKTARIT